jgi:CRP/FNR family cyclic AMP-dependent transcriptional regulator
MSFGGPLTMTLKKDELICVAGDREVDLYKVRSGKLMVFVNDGTKITPLAYLGEGEYLGELSFFDHQPRSAHVVALEECEIIKIPVEELDKQAPRWLITMATHVAQKIRRADEMIRTKGIRRQNVESIKPLSIEEQRYYYKLIEDRVN